MGAFVGLWSFSTTKFQENSRSELLLQPALNRLSFLAQPFARNSDRLYYQDLASLEITSTEVI